MAKTFGVDLSKMFGVGSANSQSVLPTIGAMQRRGPKVGWPGLPPTIRGLPWSKMLRSFRESRRDLKA